MLKNEDELRDFLIAQHKTPSIVVASTVSDGFAVCVGPIPSVSGAEVMCSQNTYDAVRRIIRGAHMAKITRGAKVERQCEECLSDIQVRAADVKRGWGRFCSKTCALKGRAKEDVPTEVDDSALDRHYPGVNPAEFVYHYHATYQTDTGAVANIDGIAQLSYEIKDMDGYRELKAMIEPDLGAQLVITNISFLGRLSDEAAAELLASEVTDRNVKVE